MISFVAEYGTFKTGTSITVTASSVNAGDLLVVTLTEEAGSGTLTGTLSDNKGETWTEAWSGVAASSRTVAQLYAVAATSGSHSVTYTPAASATLVMAVNVFTGEWGSDPLDAGKVSTAYGSKTLTPTAITPSQPDALLVTACGVIHGAGTFTAASPWIDGTPLNTNRQLTAYQIVSATGSYTRGWTWSSGSGDARAGVVAFVEAASGPSPAAVDRYRRLCGLI